VHLYDSAERRRSRCDQYIWRSDRRTVYCQHLVVTKDGAINDHYRGVAVSIDAATLECSVMEAGTAAAAPSEYRAEHSLRGKRHPTNIPLTR